MRKSRSIPVLSREEENLLAERARGGDQLARDRLIRANLRFVVKVAKSFHAPGFSLEDLISEGNIGLMKAIEHFDQEKGYRFISYAVWWIRQNIVRAIAEKSHMIRLPANKAFKLQQILKAQEVLSAERRGEQKEEGVAQRLHCDRDTVVELLSVSRDLVSLDAPVGSADDLSPLENFIEAKSTHRPEEILLENALRNDINDFLSSLSHRESEVLQHRFGLNGRQPLTLSELGSRLELTKERVRQIEKKALNRARHGSRAPLLRAHA